MNPFEIDSLDNFTKESMKFAGSFYSADIFPTIVEDLTLQKGADGLHLPLTPQRN
jgi:hypothetical protein